MDTLRTISMPEQTTTLAGSILDFLTTFIPYSVVFGIFWKVIDSILKYASEGRDARTKELIHEANAPLKEDIGKLTESIWALQGEIKKMK